MKIYQATGNRTFNVETVPSEENAKVKIKVTHVMPTLSDINIFTGAVKQSYPFIPGHMAIGAISDDRLEYGLKRGTKVILNPYIAEQSDRIDMPGRVKTRGVDIKGFLSDFVYLDIEEFTPFPEDVSEDEAIFTEKIALAMAAINSFRVEKGDYVVIVGGGTVCNIAAQLALYFQLIPILIDTSASRLARAAQGGVYYTINASEEVPFDRVKEITGGRMSEHTIIEAAVGTTGAYAFSLARFGGDCTIICENNTVKQFEADISLISRRQLRVRGVSTGAYEFDSAINILAQNILQLNDFIEKKVVSTEMQPLFDELADNFDMYFSALVQL